MLPDQALRGRVHRLGVERARHPPGAAAIERKVGAAIDNAVHVVPRAGGKPRVEIVRHALGGEHGHRVRPQLRR